MPVHAVEAMTSAPSSSLHFIPNKGQIVDTDGDLRPDVLYTAEYGGMKVFFKQDGVSYVFRRAQRDVEDAVELYRMDLRFPGSNLTAEVEASGMEKGVRNYYTAQFPEGILDVPAYGKLVYKEIYPGTDLEFEVVDGQLKYSFVLLNGADVGAIRLWYEGATKVWVDAEGRLQVETPRGMLSEDAPVSFDLGTGEEVATNFVVDGMEVKFDVTGEWDPDWGLKIDPTLGWATYFGGSGEENDELFGDVATDSQGNAYSSRPLHP
ncbi:MAG: hypothetical protein AAF570_04370 [Bacteroidota bacterium]